MTERKILISRDPVSTSDDFDHEASLDYGTTETLATFATKIFEYLPKLKNTVWSLQSGGRAVAFIYTGDDPKDGRYEIVYDILVRDIPGQKIHCALFQNVEYTFLSNPPVEMFPECETLLEKVKEYEALYHAIRRLIIKAKELMLAKDQLWHIAMEERNAFGKKGDITMLVNEIASGAYDTYRKPDIEDAMWKLWNV